eukprot:6202175-Pleurochrysis_carterae.AAC.3
MLSLSSPQPLFLQMPTASCSYQLAPFLTQARSDSKPVDTSVSGTSCSKLRVARLALPSLLPLVEPAASR